MSNGLGVSRLTLAAALLAMACGGSSPPVDATESSATMPANPAGAGDSASGEATASSTSAGAGAAAAEAGAGAAAVEAGARAGSAEAGTRGNDEDYGNAFASGDWRGYFWTATQGAGTTISPKDFTAQTSGMPRCVSGSVGVTTDNSGLAMLGANLKEDANGKMPVTPTKKGVTVFVVNNAGTPLLFQVQGPAGQWCTYLDGGGGFIPWEKLNTACWNDSGKAYNKEPITTAALLVPGSSTAPVVFDFCLLRLEESDSW